MADVDTLCILVTVVGFVLAWVLWLTHLKKKQASRSGLQEKYRERWTSLTMSLIFLHSVYFVLLSRLLILTVFLVVLFMKSHTDSILSEKNQNVGYFWVHRSHCDSLLPLSCSTRYSQLPLITSRWRTTPVRMPLHELIVQRVTAKTGLWSKQNEMELLNASDETIPLFPNQLAELGHRIKEKQLERLRSDKTLDERCYASGMASFLGFPGTMWVEWPQGSKKQSLPLKQLMSHIW